MVSRTALSETLKLAKKLRKQTLSGFSDELGIGRSTLSAILAEKENVSIDLLDQLARRLNVPTQDLIAPPGMGRIAGSFVFLQERDLQRLTPEARENFLQAVHEVERQLSQGG